MDQITWETPSMVKITVPVYLKPIKTYEVATIY